MTDLIVDAFHLFAPIFYYFGFLGKQLCFIGIVSLLLILLDFAVFLA